MRRVDIYACLCERMEWFCEPHSCLLPTRQHTHLTDCCSESFCVHPSHFLIPDYTDDLTSPSTKPSTPRGEFPTSRGLKWYTLLSLVSFQRYLGGGSDHLSARIGALLYFYNIIILFVLLTQPYPLRRSMELWKKEQGKVNFVHRSPMQPWPTSALRRCRHY